MMRAVAELTRKHNIYTEASLNPIMMDGTGMCGACRVTVDGKVKWYHHWGDKYRVFPKK